MTRHEHIHTIKKKKKRHLNIKSAPRKKSGPLDGATGTCNAVNCVSIAKNRKGLFNQQCPMSPCILLVSH